MTEHQQQVTVVEWWDATYPKLKLCMTAYPSGAIMGGKNKFGMINKMKKEGWRKGVCDLFIAVPRKGKAGLWVEMKDVKKTLCSVSDEQMAHIDLMNEMGYEAIWCAGADIAIAAIKVYMNEE